MGFLYHKLPESRRSRMGVFPARVWLVVRRAAVKVVGLYVGHRRKWAARHVRRVAWAGLWGRVRRAVGIPARPRSAQASYDLASYARNFDDGVWKEDEEGFWRSGSFAYRFGHSGRLAS